ncbi:uncharacterized protein Z520_04476 [Fonsecaea multimorphosa CBS 102226]|uniref:UBC core domain-containing protein n=1 Tax=Fonsecaea multimorphosa CBS 102226 TaxID=1442371 RepID=A0A0D2HD81_9EURO|nr:uncharacterized protein Z520_04476 [Fonsecaea multimorphosa CBS 102226]KIX99840.1 hypothetical protein Z520_04476 [Fonsecaea multimorphosa CBS 102226]OAL26319.1 hypothetical protein AYO22_04237 [Fonsecaea multimorphosa]
MGRKLFLSHLDDANRLRIERIHSIHSPEEGVVAFTYVYPTGNLEQVNIEAFANDLGEYPDGNSFMVCSKDTSLDPVVARTLQKVTENAHGKSVIDLVTEVAGLLTMVMTGDRVQEDLITGYLMEDDEFEFIFEGDSDNECFGLDTCKSTSTERGHNTIIDAASMSTAPQGMVDKICADLRALKGSGFRVAIFGNIATAGILCVSIRVSKLGLSDEALEAWNVPRKHYFLLLIRYMRGYLDAGRVVTEKDLSDFVEMRVGLCGHYKPSLHEVLRLFQYTKPDDEPPADDADAISADHHPFEALFIGNSINQFLNQRAFKIIAARELYQLSWLGAEKFINDRQAAPSTSNFCDMMPYHCDDGGCASNLPPVVIADHMLQNPLAKASLPLILMQFALRHFVRCTEFCLVCHCRVDDGFEALKPYVCLNPLCLYQYMKLGLGPRLEWEIMAQPYVVDLLVSFCYAAAVGGRLKELPIGMDLVVPVIPRPSILRTTAMASYRKVHTTWVPKKSFTCTWNTDLKCLTVGQGKNTSIEKLKPGDWIVLLCAPTEAAAHCRVKSLELPQIWLDASISVPYPGHVHDLDSPSEEGKTDCYLYDKTFDSLAQEHQENAIMTLLDALPSVIKMRGSLEGQGKSQEPSLEASPEKIPKAALHLLRWIVASNRSCIMQVDDIESKDGPLIPGKVTDRVGGMYSWIQFRLAQGAPDKEKRFNDSVKRHARATGTMYPTLFAWHGSRTANWHSIIRLGLRYDEVINGRAYGHGIYLSPSAHISLRYSREVVPERYWQGSELKIANVLSLQEVVNDPAKFTSTAPHYVVPKVDWVQTRYLFVQTGSGPRRDPVGIQIYKQDPNRTAVNEMGLPLKIPITAISKARRPGSSIGTVGTPCGKRTKTVSQTNLAAAEQQEEDADSVVSDEDDLAIFQAAKQADDNREPFFGCDTNAESLCVNGKKRPAEVAADTDFVPGELDITNIKFMEPPKDANPVATKALMRLLKEALKTQDDTPPATLGWYIDRSLINNVYQWIVALHSFPSDLPLAKDMKSAGVTSIVMEMRFTSQYPFSPPFIRVVKPRFLPFSRGGGGNVTEGGAMCMEVLTNNGWSASLTVESLLLQVRLVMSDTERPARLDRRPGTFYNVGEAKAAYLRACRNHGWEVPAGFDTIQELD